MVERSELVVITEREEQAMQATFGLDPAVVVDVFRIRTAWYGCPRGIECSLTLGMVEKPQPLLASSDIGNFVTDVTVSCQRTDCAKPGNVHELADMLRRVTGQLPVEA